ncbi:MAG: prolipoprotein diacylglyceryl transferase [Acidobacteriota bacterium]
MLPEVSIFGLFILSGYQFFYITGVVFTVVVILLLSRREKLDLVEMINYLIFGIIAGVTGTKIYAVSATFLGNPGLSIKNPDILLKSLRSGGVFYGGIFAMVIFAYFYTRKFFMGSEWRIFDITVVGGALGHMFGRLGCFSAGCCYGLPADISWGVKFPFLGKDIHRFHEIFLHPTQIYEAVLNLTNFIILLLVWRKRKFEGQVFSLYLINYGFIRFFVEFFRNDGGRGYIIKSDSRLLSLSIPQLISIIMIIAGFFIYRRLKCR